MSTTIDTYEVEQTERIKMYEGTARSLGDEITEITNKIEAARAGREAIERKIRELQDQSNEYLGEINSLKAERNDACRERNEMIEAREAAEVELFAHKGAGAADWAFDSLGFATAIAMYGEMISEAAESKMKSHRDRAYWAAFSDRLNHLEGIE